VCLEAQTQLPTMMGGAPGGHGGLQPPSAAAPGAAAAYTAPPPTVQGPCRVALLIEVTEAMAGLWPEFRAGYVDPVLRACELGGPVEVAVITFGSREAAFSGGAAVESSGWLSSIAEVSTSWGGGGWGWRTPVFGCTFTTGETCMLYTAEEGRRWLGCQQSSTRGCHASKTSNQYSIPGDSCETSTLDARDHAWSYQPRS
jgi:hypothetical protein